MKNVFILTFLASGVGCIYYGVKMILGSLMVGVGRPVSEAEKKADKQLADQIYKESLDRGDGWAMANFYRANTEDMSSQGRDLDRMFLAVGLVLVTAGFAIIYGWWQLIS